MKLELKESNSDKWYVINTNPRCENVVYHTLCRESFEVFLPEVSVRRKYGKKIVEPLFPGYLFVRLNLGLSSWVKIKYFPGVRKILSFGNNPTPVPEAIIAAIEQKIKGNDYSHKILPFKKGDRVRFTKGYLEGLEGIFTGEVSRKDRVRILLEAVRWASVVEVQANELTKVG